LFHSFNLNGLPLRERSGRCRNSASPFNLKSETLFKLKDYISHFNFIVIGLTDTLNINALY
ncbi:MAG: hypothetical protein LBC86_01675, partial [Oscillospiraceae bacterium]|nr:hypothetical protein [Oscillospiraceae bacterium]